MWQNTEGFVPSDDLVLGTLNVLLSVFVDSFIYFFPPSLSGGSKKDRHGCEVLTLMLEALQSIVSSEALPAHRVLVNPKLHLIYTYLLCPRQTYGSKGQIQAIKCLFVLWNGSQMFVLFDCESFRFCLRLQYKVFQSEYSALPLIKWERWMC